MKLSTSLVFLAVSIAAIVAPAQAAPAETDTQPAAKSPVDRLDDVRAQIQGLETPIIQTYLARAGLGGSVDNEDQLMRNLLRDIGKKTQQPDPEVAKWLQTPVGQKFASSYSFPPGVVYETPVVLARDEVLDKPVVGKGIFPTGRRPQDPKHLVNFIEKNLLSLPKNPSLDPASAALLDASLVQLLSARIVLGYEVALAKFDWQKDDFCRYLKDPKAKDIVTENVVDGKQEVRLLGRVREKAKAFSETYRRDPDYPEHTTDNILRIFQAYLIPITAELEVQTILALGDKCK